MATSFPVHHYCYVHGDKGGVDIRVESRADYLRLARELLADGFTTSYYVEDFSPLFTYFHQDELPPNFR